MADGVSVSVYWADEDPKAPPEVSSWEMSKLDAKPCLDLLRTQPSLEAALNIPGGRRSGLSLRCYDPSGKDDD